MKPISLKFMSRPLLVALIGLLTSIFAFGQTSDTELPKGKQTKLELYVTAKEAYEKWREDPENVHILDVRTAEEYLFVGHFEMAWNIPMFFQTFEWDSKKHHFPMKPNPDFIMHIKEVFQSGDIILITCRSGGRSAMAVNQLAEAGFTNVYNITDGMEGDKVEDPQNVFEGQRLKNGWKNSGCPWTYRIDPKMMLIQAE